MKTLKIHYLDIGYSDAMSLETIKAYITKQLEFARDSYVQDLEALSEEQLVQGVGGDERKGIDFSYEVAYVNRRFATRLRGETPDPWTDYGCIVAPDEFKTKEAAIENVKASTNEFIEVWKSIPAEEMTRVIALPTGDTSPLDLAFSCCWHTGYHDAQLNYIQELKGDLKMHWQD